MKRLSNTTAMTDAPFLANLFNSPRWAWVWLVVRVWLGYKWLEAGIHKLGSADWMQTGVALKGFWERAVLVPEAPARPAITYDWYRAFLQFMLDHQSYVWFGKLVAIGELLVGIALIAGIFVGFTAFFAGFMNFNYMLAGTLSTNPFFFLLAVLLLIAWKTAGYWGGDYYVFKYLGMPWNKGKWFAKKTV